MSYRLRLDPDLGCVIVRFEGEVDLAQLDAVREEVERHPDFRPGLDRLWDERDCTLTVRSEELEELAKRWSRTAVQHGKRRVAYFVREGLRWGLNRQFEAQREDPDVVYQLHTDWDALKAWLGLPPALPDPAQLLAEEA